MTSGVKPGLPYEAEALAYYAEYGRAMAAWANVEAALQLIVEMFFGDGLPRHIVAIGITGIQGFHSKLQFVDLAVTRGMAGIRVENAEGKAIGDGRMLHQSTWQELVNDLDALSTKRNHLAHYVTNQFPEYPKEGRRIALCAWRGPKKTPRDRPPPGSYTVKKLICTRREFDLMQIRLLNFAHRLGALPEPLELPGKPEDDLPTTQQIADQMHAALGHQRESARERKRREDEYNASKSLEIDIHVRPNETAQGNGSAAEDAQHPADPARAEEGKDEKA